MLSSTLKLMVIAVVVFAATSTPSTAKRVALIIGVQEYKHLEPLANPVRDAQATSDLLSKNGFLVHKLVNVNQERFETGLAEFKKIAKDAEEAIVLYSGHGMTVVKDRRLVNALTATDSAIDCKTRSSKRMVTMKQVLATVANVPKQVLLFDACRNDAIRDCESTPLTEQYSGFQQISTKELRSKSGPTRSMSRRGMKPINEQEAQKANTSILISYSTGLGQTALDGPEGGNSPFVAALLDEFKKAPTTTVRNVLEATSKRVAAVAGQRPWVVTDGGEPEMCLSGGACVRDPAERNAKLATQSEFLANLAQRPESDGATGLLLALAGVPDETLVNGVPLAARPAVPAIQRALYNRQRDLRERMVLADEGAEISKAQFAADGKLIVTSGKQFARIWDAKTGQLKTKFKPPGSPPLSLDPVTNADATRLVTINGNGHVHVWDGRTGSPTARLDPKMSGRVSFVAMSPDSQRIVTVGGSRFRVWDAATGVFLSGLNFRGLRLLQSSFSPDGRWIAIASTAGSAVWILEAATFQVTSVLKSKRGEMLTAVFGPDGRHVVTSGSIGPGRLWEVATAKQIAVLESHAPSVGAATFSRDGTRVMMAASGGPVRIWDVATGTEQTVLRGQSYARATEFSPDNSRVVTGHMDGIVRVWDVDNGEIITALRGHRTAIISASFTPDGRTVLSASNDGTARLWDVREHPSATIFKTHSSAEDAAFSPDGTRVATAGSRGKFGRPGWRGVVRLWDARTGSALADLKGHVDLVYRVAFDPKRKHLASASRDGSVRIWDAGSGKQLKVLAGGGEDGFRTLTYGPHGRRLAAASWSSDAFLWDAKTGERIAVLTGHKNGVWKVAFSPDGRKLVTVGKDPHARVWDSTTGKQIMLLTSRAEQLRSVTFSPNGSRIATTPWGGPIQIWDAETGREIAALEGQPGIIWSVAFSPDGTKLISTGNDHSGARLWDIDNAKESWRTPGFLVGLTFSPDGRRAVVTGDDGRATIFDVASGVNIAEATYVPEEIKRPSFSPDGKRLLLVRGKFGAAAVRYFKTLQELTDHSKRIVPRCLTLVERKRFKLPLEPERWCITGAGREAEKNPANWAPKWPYRTARWRDWLVNLDRGENVVPPQATEEPIQW